MFEIEKQYLKVHLKELQAKHKDKKIIAIVGQECVGAYNSLNEAFFYVTKSHKAGTFLLERLDGSSREPAIFQRVYVND